jgi:uncharacterized protein
MRARMLRMLDAGILESVARRLAEEAPVDAVWLFGSEAAGRARADSDLDLGILFSRSPSPEELLRLRALAAEMVGREVDLVDLRPASPILGMQIIRHGRLVLDQDPVSTANFVASLQSRRYDVMRSRREAERNLLERVRSSVT